MTNILKKLFGFASPLKNHQGYRSDIDGLRALAVIIVVGFHAFPNYFPGGFIGVDIFFIISGYLISGIVFRQLEANRFSFIDFYIKRVNRIFPALIVVLLACILLGKFFFFQNEVIGFNKSLMAAVAFVANIFFYNESGYFDSSAESKPLLHLWSLGIEEQFYILWPILLIFVWKRLSLRPWIMGSLILLSMALNLALVESNQTAAFYLPFSRFWELLLGSSLAYFSISNKKPSLITLSIGQDKLLRNTSGFLGISLIVLCMFLLNRSSTFPGWWALMPVTAALLIIAAGKESLFNKYILSNRVVVFIGVISYPIYLWHWPLLSFLHVQMGQVPKEYRIVAVLLSVVFAWFTYVLVERPVRFGIKSPFKTLVISIILFGIGIYGYFDARYAAKHIDEKDAFVSYYADYTKNNNLNHNHRFECSFTDTNNKVRESIPSSCYEPATKNSVFIWGDSHAQHLNYGLTQLLPKNISILQIATFGCAPSVNFMKQGVKTSCDASNQLAFNKIKLAKPDVVVLAQRENHELNDWVSITSNLKNLGVKKIVIVGPVPEWNQYLYRYFASHYWDQKPDRLKSNLDQKPLVTDKLMKKMYGDSQEIIYLSIIDKVCHVDGCLTYLGDNPQTGLFTFDYGHLSLIASEYVAKEILVPVIMPIDAK